MSLALLAYIIPTFVLVLTFITCVSADKEVDEVVESPKKKARKDDKKNKQTSQESQAKRDSSDDDSESSDNDSDSDYDMEVEESNEKKNKKDFEEVPQETASKSWFLILRIGCVWMLPWVNWLPLVNKHYYIMYNHTKCMNQLID